MKIILAAALALTFPMMSTAYADEASKLKATDFATKAALANMFEIEAAKVEIAKGKAADAKQFAQDMLKDHGKAGPLLSDAAKRDGIALPAALGQEDEIKIQALNDSDPSNLDQAYLSTQVTAHEDAVALFTAYSKGGPQGQLKNAAAKLLPDLRMHLTRVKGLTAK